MKFFSYNSMKITLFLSLVRSALMSIVFYDLASIVSNDVNEVLKNSLKVLVIGLLLAIVIYMYYYMVAITISNITMDIHQKLNKNILSISLTDFNKKESGEYVSNYTNDVDATLTKSLNSYLDIFDHGFSVLFFGIALLKIHYILFLVALCTFGMSALVPKIFEKKYSAIMATTQKVKAEFLNKIRELVQGYGTLVENNSLDTFDKKARGESLVLASQNKKQDTFVGVMNAVLTFNAMITFIVSTLSVAILIGKGYVAVGVLVSGAAIMSNFNSSVSAVTRLFATYKASLGFIKERIPAALLNDEEKTFVKPFFNPKNIMNGELRFNREKEKVSNVKLVNIKVPLGEKELSFKEEFSFEKGKKYAIIGKSGSGKSTLLKVLTGETSSYKGDVIVDGVIKEKEKMLFNAVSYCNQETYLFNDTIEKNVTLDKGDEKVREILDILDLGEFDLKQEISENGKNLSGGQKQRLGLARALYNDNDIIVLDEATSALDKKTRKKIEKHLLSLDKMVIMITHHLDEADEKLFDKIYNLD